jgi:hypothetical protein
MRIGNAARGILSSLASRRRPRGGWPWLAVAAALAGLAAPAAALDYQVHGFAAQGFALSGGNNIIGDSMHGNYQYFELGVNGTVETDFGVRLAAQEVVRRSGELDDGELRLDYGFADWQALGGGAVDLGVRAGRVKNPFGLFNDTRDVVFTRPGILLPLSVYQETQGARSLLFSSDGGQLYGGWSHDEQYTSLTVTRAADFDVREHDKRVFFAGSPGFGGELRFSDFLMGRLMHEWGAGVRVAASYLAANLAYQPASTDPFPVAGDLDFQLYVLSGRYDAERYSLTAEYQLTHSQGNFGAPVHSKGDGGYVQVDYRFAPQWSAMARLDASYTDRNDRDGDQCGTGGFGPPRDRHECFTLGAGAGLRWQPDTRWGVWGEYYRFDGTSQVPTIENLGRSKEPHWDLFLLMAAYRF